MFGPPDFHRQLAQELERRTQGPRESLTSFITTINEYYEKLASQETDDERVKRVLRQMHPSYKPYMWHRKFSNLYEMMEYAQEVQANLYLDKVYQPPSSPSESVDPSLAYRGQRRDDRLSDTISPDTRSRGLVRFIEPNPRPPSSERRDYSLERAQRFEANSLIKSPREDRDSRDRSRDRS
jgi:hypothetical protein